jgi:hypothetical protein
LSGCLEPDDVLEGGGELFEVDEGVCFRQRSSFRG